MKNNKKTAIIAVVLVMAVALMGFGFAAWSTTLTVSGKASAEATWDVHFQSVTASAVGGTATEGECEITDAATDSVTIDLGETKLGTPGDYVVYTITVVNEGTVKAVLTSENFKVNYTADPDGFIKVEVPETICEELEADGDTCTFDVVVYLDPSVDADSIDPDTCKVDDIAIELVYEQIAAESVPSATHKEA